MSSTQELVQIYNMYFTSSWQELVEILSFGFWILSDFPVLYISTSVWVLRTPNARVAQDCNMKNIV